MTLYFNPDNYVLMRFALAMDEKNVKKTHLHLASKLRWDSFQRYLDWLQDMDYIRCCNSDGTEIYSLTIKGKEMFDKLEKFLECIRPVKSNNATLGY